MLPPSLGFPGSGRASNCGRDLARIQSLAASVLSVAVELLLCVISSNLALEAISLTLALRDPHLLGEPSVLGLSGVALARLWSRPGRSERGHAADRVETKESVEPVAGPH